MSWNPTLIAPTRLSRPALFAVLLLATVWNFEAAAVNPALAAIAAAFPDASVSKVFFVSTAPFITSMIFSVASGKLADRYDKKLIAAVGLTIYGVSGVAPAFAENLDTILALRLLTGAGVGLVLPISAMILSEHYAAGEKEQVMGYMVAVFNASNVLVSIAVGLMLGHGWHVAFYAFAFILVVLGIVIVACPKSPPSPDVRVARKTHAKAPMPLYAYAMLGFMVFLWMAFAYLLLSLATFDAARRIVPMLAIGLILAIPGAANAVAALMYPRVSRFGVGLVFVALCALALGFVATAHAHAVPLLVLGLLLVGLGQGILVPYVLSSTVSNVPADARDRSLGLVQAGVHIGPLLATFLVAWMLRIARGEPYLFAYTAAAAFVFAVAMVILAASVFQKRSAAAYPN